MTFDINGNWITDSELDNAFRAVNNAGGGFAVNELEDEDTFEDQGCREAAEAEGWRVLGEIDVTGTVVAETLEGRIIVVGDAHGPWGCDVTELIG